MANTVTSTPNDLTLSAGYNSSKSGKISWTAPTVPDGATIKSCVLTGKATASSTNVTSIKINDQSITVSTSGYNFTIDFDPAYFIPLCQKNIEEIRSGIGE